MFIAGLGTAAPRQRYVQRECWDALEQSRHWADLNSRSRAILKKVLNGGSGISARHLALPGLEAAFDLSPDALHLRFKETAPRLAAEAAGAALQDAGQPAEAVDALIISTCTGYLCPGLTSYVAELLGLRPDTLLLDLVGQGCGAALPNMRTGEALLLSGRAQVVLSVCVEVCTAAFYLDNDPGVLISACLFGDGAGAAVLTPEPGRARAIHWETSASILEPGERDLLRFEQKNGMLRNVLALQVPKLAAAHASALADRVLEAAGVTRSEIQAWILHPGGRDVLVALQRELGFPADALRWSNAVLNEYGNISSASVYFVLKHALAGRAPAGWWWLSSFGAGFSCHGALLKAGTP